MYSRNVSLGAWFLLAMISACKSEIHKPNEEVVPSPVASASVTFAPGSPESCAQPRPGPTMVAVSFPQGPSYCIDSTKVTQSQYAVFLEQVKGKTLTLPEGCESTTIEAPLLRDDQNISRCGEYFIPDKKPDAPMVCVSWCEASAYCQWAGKRLCSSKPVGEEKSEVTGQRNRSGEWANACSNQGKTKYTTGDEYKPGVCADPIWDEQKWPETKNKPKTPEQTSDVKEPETCHGVEPPFDQLYGMTGSWWEWVALDGSPDGVGRPRQGGYYGKNSDNAVPYIAPCEESSLTGKDARGGTSVRCCAD